MIEFDQPGYLDTPVGHLNVNQAMTLTDGSTGYFMADVTKCSGPRPLRVVRDSIPQGDGRIPHRRFTDGIDLTIALQLWTTIGADGEPACGADLRVMLETLGLYLQSILNGRGRWFWTPSDYTDDRLLDEARWLREVERTLEGKLTTVTFQLDSPFPYFVDATQGLASGSAGPISVPAGVPTIVPNDGNSNFQPVIKALGPLSSFSIENQSVVDGDGFPLEIAYDSSRPFPTGESGVLGSSDLAEIDTFRETIYLNSDQQNLKPGIDWETTDYFFLAPGDNTILSDVDCEFLVNNAWTPA